ncbi:MAG TPA: glycosyltransferase family 1 protein [Actinomycetaceae bacterium]|nr:glycosyltransferase family 1 protein [Actinomycetaceae bacterium]
MRIAYFTEVFLPKIDGVVTRILRTLDELEPLGHEAIVFGPGNPPKEYAGAKVVRVNSVPFKPLYPEARFGLPTPGIAEALADFRPDVVHAVNPVWLGAYGVLASRRRDIPLLASFHTDLPKYTVEMGISALKPTAEGIIRFLHNQAEINLCTSAPMVERAREFQLRRVDLWPKAVDTRTYHPDRYSREMRARLTGGHPEAPLVLYVGRLSKEKNLADLVEPIRRLEDLGARLAFVGSGPQSEELEEMFAGTNTVFAGYMNGDELGSAFASADVFAFPSTTETLGFVAMESMASGVPVVGADAGGIPDVIDDGVNGLLVPPRDPDAMTARLRMLITDPGLRARLGAEARAESERHSWRTSTETLVRYYQDAIALHGAGGGAGASRLLRAVSRPAPWRRTTRAQAGLRPAGS